ncbi:MAG: MFS transporter [Acidimicrobiia bacterium]
MSLLRDRRFALLACGQAVNAIGSWCALVALWGFASFRFHAGPSDLALLGLAWALPAVLLGPVAGLPVDRFGPKRALVVADSLAAGVALLFLLADTFTALVVFGAIEGMTRAFSEPAFQALAPRIVRDDQLAAANGVLATASQSAIAFGPLLAAGAIAAVGIEGAFVVNAVTYLIGVAVLVPFRIGAVPVAHTRETGVVSQVTEGLRVVAARPALRSLFALAGSVYLIWGAFIVVEPIYVREVLHGSPTLFAMLQSTFGVGLVLTGIVVSRLGERLVRWSVVCAAAIGSAFGAALYVGTATIAVAFVGLFLWGVVTAVLIAPLRTLMQRASPVETHGRVFALDGMVHSTGDLVSLPLVGLVVGLVGVQVAGVAVAAVPLTGGILTWRVVRGRRAGFGEPVSDQRVVAPVVDARPEPAVA